MAGNLSPEERARIAEEEKIRLETHINTGARFLKWGLKWYLIIIAVVVVLGACSCFAYFGMLGSLLSQSSTDALLASVSFLP